MHLARKLMKDGRKLLEECRFTRAEEATDDCERHTVMNVLRCWLVLDKGSVGAVDDGDDNERGLTVPRRPMSPCLPQTKESWMT